MSREQVSVSELLLSLDSSELQEAEQVRAAVNQQLSTDKGGAVLSSLVDFYLETSSSQAALLLSSIREPHHKVLLEKLNESLGRPGTRLATLTLLGHLIRKQPPWIHRISHSALLSSLLRCLKTDGDVLILITGVLVLVTLLPMIPQAGKQHINDFFDVFGRLTSRSCKNPGHVPVVYMVHLHAGVYSLFHRLYGMFPCNFISYLRLHYSMKENLDTFQEVVKPMLDHVRVHPELVTGTQDYELDPSRWRCYEVHDIVIECSRVSLDPLESSCEEDSSSSSLLRPPPLSLLPHLDLTCSSQITDAVSSSDELTPTLPVQANDVTWSPAIQCGLSTPPLEQSVLGSAHSLSWSTCVSGEKWPSSASVPVSSLAEDKPGNSSHVRSGVQVKMITDGEGSTFQPITEKDERGLYDVIDSNSEDINLEESQQPPPSSSSQPRLFTSTPSRAFSASDLPPAPCFTPSHPSSEEGGPVHSDCSPAPPYEPLFEFALPRAAMLFIEKKSQEVLEKKEGGVEGENREEGAETSVSPLKVLDQLIVHGHDAHVHDAHVHLSRRLSAGNKSVDWSHFGGKQQSMKSKGPSQEEELQSLRNQLLLVHSQLQYERFKRQQHAIRNRRLLRRVINATALEEQSAAMKSQLGVQDDEIRSLRSSLDEEQRRYSVLQQETHAQNKQLHTHIAQLLQLHRDEQRESQRLQGELQECQSRLRDLEAELQKANNKAYNAEHLLTQLSLKLCSSEQLQQQMFLLNQQLVLLKETNRALREQLEGGGMQRCTEASMLQCSVSKEYLRLKDSDVQHRQKLEAANHRITELESQLVKKDQLLLNQKKLLEDTKNQNRAELSASDSRCGALRRVTLTLQTEMLHLYSQIHLDTHAGGGANPHSQDISSSDGDTLPDAQGSPESCPLSSSAGGIVNGAMEALSTSPISVSLSPIDSPLAVGSFLEQQARRLFGPTDQRQEEEEEEEQEEVVKVQSESPPLGQEVEEAMLLTGSPQTEPSQAAAPSVAPADLTPAVQQRRHELSIMDYDEMLPDI